MTETESGGRLLSIPLVLHAGVGFPAEVDLEPSAERYVGYYENQYGEQLVYVHEKDGAPTAEARKTDPPVLRSEGHR
jgi:hypothetical protein